MSDTTLSVSTFTTYAVRKWDEELFDYREIVGTSSGDTVAWCRSLHDPPLSIVRFIRLGDRQVIRPARD